MNKNIGILGGDLRIANLGKILAEDGYSVYTYGLENVELSNSKIIKCKNIKEICKFCDNIISGIPFSKDEAYVNAPFSKNEINIKDAFKILSNKTLIAGAIKQEIKKCANDISIIDLMDNEKFTILNVIPTVEGAIQIAMENTNITIHNSKCLVLGYGRIGKLLSKTLRDLGADVSCTARNDKDLTWIKTLGYKDIHTENLIDNLSNKYDIIFNTVPSLILDENKLKLIKEKNSDITIIELASMPGGIDFEKAEEYGIEIIKAQGLPGKVAPVTSAKYIKETLKTILN